MTDDFGQRVQVSADQQVERGDDVDGHRVCDAIAAIGEPSHVHAWTERFSLPADPGRLALLQAAGFLAGAASPWA
ncbi:hypothetical protein ABT404_19050 [Streptomyces hyaluromycini]|uniref:Uncharacterized protein n=1 Tax=Streptomyces hyaluromycini TaxID=1377993 RepID=A0ABV1WXP7_9ACTN